jgi:hypothetical protein
MTTRTRVLIGSAVVLLAAAGYLLYSLGGNRHPTPVDDPPDPPVTRHQPTRPSGGHFTPPDPVNVGGRDPVPKKAAPVDSGPVVRSRDDAKPNFYGTASRPGMAAQLQREARVKQAALYRMYITNGTERTEKLKQVLARLQRSGGATPNQLTQIQTQLQQIIDAEPRMKAHLEQLEKEIKADEEQVRKEKEEFERLKKEKQE